MSEPPGGRSLDEVRRKLVRQAKMRAITLYRDSTGAGHADARRAVERMRAGQAPADPRLATTSPVSAEARAIGEALRSGKTIEAIRLYRAATGAGLRESKLAIDAILAEKSAGPKPRAEGAIVRRRRVNPILVLLALAVLFGTALGILAGR